VPDRENSEREQGREGGIYTGVVRFGGAAPTATALPGLKAAVVFDTPTAGSVIYKVTKTTGGSDSDAQLDGQPSAVGNRTTLTVKRLTAGAKYTFKVTATSSTTGAAATSQPSNEITATAVTHCRERPLRVLGKPPHRDDLSTRWTATSNPRAHRSKSTGLCC
jgi:hypothetical protein